MGKYNITLLQYFKKCQYNKSSKMCIPTTLNATLCHHNFTTDWTEYCTQNGILNRKNLYFQEFAAIIFYIFDVSHTNQTIHLCQSQSSVIDFSYSPTFHLFDFILSKNVFVYMAFVLNSHK